MADDPENGFVHESFKGDGFGIGQGADGKLDTFPLSELDAKLRERDEAEALITSALGQLQADPEPDDLRAEYEATEAEPEDDE
jgi:hypothetical protein